MTNQPETARLVRAVPGRRLVVAGIIRRHDGRTLTVRVTAAGVTGTLRKEARR
ncbi:hypothetical protein [Streptomyces sp. CAI-85]|uniref:hypothetical protein n=1 Tax=Streptomyces sp. CAI-85 TaxID=1472662 RepID=UPI00158783C1|nr:hypothetical protein [Streptomyces sp. CAI-85]NUV60681.1 hypothetical protein [Streptomyces sp. CAI-85]